MARIRTIKPEFWTDEKVVGLTFASRLLFIGLWNFCDDDGRMVFSPFRIKMQIFPADLDTDIDGLLKELEESGLIFLYEDGKQKLLQIPKFQEHQKIDRRSPSKLTAPDGHKPKQEDGWVYLLFAPEVGKYKIGKAAFLEGRVGALQKQSPTALELVVAIQSPTYSQLEASLHAAFKHARANGEWFALTPAEVEEIKRVKNGCKTFRRIVVEPSTSPTSGMEGKGKECKGRNKTLASDKPTPDPRKAILRDALKKGWQWKNPNAGECPWGAPEEVALNALLADVGKDMPGESLVQCVRNKFLSDEAHGSKPRSYIRLLLTYMESPLDRFGKPKSLGANNGKQAIGEKENARRASTVEVLRERAVGRRAGNPDGRDGSELPDRTGAINQKSLPDGMGSDCEVLGDRSTTEGVDSLPAEPGAEILPEPKRSSRGVTDSSISPAFRSLRPAVVVP